MASGSLPCQGSKKAKRQGNGKLAKSPTAYAILWAHTVQHIAASWVMFVIDIDDKGPPGIQYYGKTRISHPYQTLFNFVSDQDNGVLRQAIVVVDNTTGHKVPVHSAPTSDNCGKPFA
ncbi:hypothetical protein B0T13DRAFT_503664 [Neurospora crassa]|nr:hypothetical protein B0T13DRAFT_503664 [Neurospora crassa]